MKLHTENYGDNLHATANAINKKGWGEYVVVMQSNGMSTQVVFKMPAEMVYKIRKENRSYCMDPHHDDPET
jgi:hypothetical protein